MYSFLVLHRSAPWPMAHKLFGFGKALFECKQPVRSFQEARFVRF
jgi:hypothetical protein